MAALLLWQIGFWKISPLSHLNGQAWPTRNRDLLETIEKWEGRQQHKWSLHLTGKDSCTETTRQVEASSWITKLKVIAGGGGGGAMVRNHAERMSRQRELAIWNGGGWVSPDSGQPCALIQLRGRAQLQSSPHSGLQTLRPDGSPRGMRPFPPHSQRAKPSACRAAQAHGEHSFHLTPRSHIDCQTSLQQIVSVGEKGQWSTWRKEVQATIVICSLRKTQRQRR